MTRILVIGAGTMGLPMAQALSAARHPVRVSDREDAALARAQERGLTPAARPSADLDWAEAVVLSLPSSQVVRAVVDSTVLPHLEGRDRPLLVIDTTTADPATSRQLMDALARTGVAYVEAPLLGHPADVGAWTALLSGDAAACEQARALLEGSIAERVRIVGPAGAASIMKVLNNLMFATITAVTAEVIAGLEEAGLDPAIFIEAVAGSRAGTVSGLFREIAPRMVAGELDSPRFTVDLVTKDAGLAVAVLDRLGAAHPVADAVQGVCQAALRSGAGRQDFAAVISAYRAASPRSA